jgi:hypothetical protein
LKEVVRAWPLEERSSGRTTTPTSETARTRRFGFGRPGRATEGPVYSSAAEEEAASRVGELPAIFGTLTPSTENTRPSSGAGQNGSRSECSTLGSAEGRRSDERRPDWCPPCATHVRANRV